MKHLFDLLASFGGKIVNTSLLDSENLSQASASNRIYVDENRFGFVWLPNINKLPKTKNEIKEFKKWYPLYITTDKIYEGLLLTPYVNLNMEFSILQSHYSIN